MRSALPIPAEPRELLDRTRARIARSPSRGRSRIDNGNLMLDALWPSWKPSLRARKIRKEQFRKIAAAYQNEVRLWVMGERTWEHCVEGLIGRVERRANQKPGETG